MDFLFCTVQFGLELGGLPKLPILRSLFTALAVARQYAATTTMAVSFFPI